MDDPSRISADVTGSFELHIFVAPLAPDEATAARFDAVCRQAGTPGSPMKGLLLQLDFVQRGFVGVLQSSRYCQGTVADARREAAADAAMLRAAGFTVLREKVEAVASNDGVPLDASDESRMPPGRYFEFHLLIRRGDGDGTLSASDMGALRGLASDLSSRFGTPVPLSYNQFKPGQRFLNLRTYGLGRREADERVAQIERAVGELGLAVTKVIREYICADTNKALDQGWLEPLASAERGEG